MMNDYKNKHSKVIKGTVMMKIQLMTMNYIGRGIDLKF